MRSRKVHMVPKDLVFRRERLHLPSKLFRSGGVRWGGCTKVNYICTGRIGEPEVRYMKLREEKSDQYKALLPTQH